MAHLRTCIALGLAVLVVFLAAPLLMRLSVERFLFAEGVVPRTDAAIVLGASVSRGKPSPLLAARADEAAALYLQGKVSKLLVTGDNGALSHDEVGPVRKYLLSGGIPTRDIFLDHAGFDTYSSMYRARHVFGVRSATIVTQDFHLPRAVFLARRLGIEAYGVAASSGGASAYEYLREIPASWKALFDLAFHRRPKYLGPAIPIKGDGEQSW